jgi:bacterioferritin-associated ferredoxin
VKCNHADCGKKCGSCLEQSRVVIRCIILAVVYDKTVWFSAALMAM